MSTFSGKAFPLRGELAKIGLFVADILDEVEERTQELLSGLGDGGGATRTPLTVKNMKRDTIHVENRSGAGGSETYRVDIEFAFDGEAEQAAGARSRGARMSLAFCSRDPELDAASESRTLAAVQVLSEAGFFPRHVAHGEDWVLNVWEDDEKSAEPFAIQTVSDMRLLGRAVALLHKRVPPAWFDPFREGLKKQFPLAYGGDASEGSHIWWYSCRTAQLLGDIATTGGQNDEEKQWLAEYVQPMFTPLTAAGARIVTCHGDLHAGNILRVVAAQKSSSDSSIMPEVQVQDEPQDAPGLRFLDLEFTTANAALNDLAYVCFHYEDMPVAHRTLQRDDVNEMRRTFLASYLEHVQGDSTTSGSADLPKITKSDVDRLLVDAFLGACGHHFGPLSHFSPLGGNLNLLKQFKTDAKHLCENEAEQKRFHEIGPEQWLAEKEYIKEQLIDDPGWGKQSERYTEFAFIRRILDSCAQA
eukprot:g13010.t1